MSYRNFLIRRALSMVPIWFGLTILIFGLARVLPGDPARMALGPRATDEQVQSLRDQMGLDDPIWEQYINYMTGLFQGDMGVSLLTNNNVARDIAWFFPATFELTTMGMLIAILLGVPLGVIAGLNKDQAEDNASRAIAFFGVSLPPFWAGIMLQLIFAFVLLWLPGSGRLSDAVVGPQRVTGLLLVDSLLAFNFEAFTSGFAHLLLPAFTLALAPLADITRMTRSSFIEEYNKEYVQALRTHGVPGKLIAYKYVLKKSFASTLTIIGLDYGFLLGSAFLIEYVFAWPGMAAYGVEAILRKDINAIIGVTLVVGTAFLIVNFLVDVLYGYFDPRVRHGEETR